MGTVVVAGIVAALVGLAIRSLVKDKKNGVSLQCGGNCKNCHGHCEES